MGTRGFTLIEMLVVLAIIATLTAIASLNWNRMSTKANIEGQIKAVHADMMRIRMEALYEKRERSVVFSGQDFRVYSSTVITSTPLSTKNFKFRFVFPGGGDVVRFNTRGMVNGTQTSICVDPYNNLLLTNDASVDSLVVSQARINLGKRDEGGTCVSGNIKQK